MGAFKTVAPPLDGNNPSLFARKLNPNKHEPRRSTKTKKSGHEHTRKHADWFNTQERVNGYQKQNSLQLAPAPSSPESPPAVPGSASGAWRCQPMQLPFARRAPR